MRPIPCGTSSVGADKVSAMRRLALAGVAMLALCALTGCSNPEAGCDDFRSLIDDYEAIQDEAADLGDAMTADALAEFSARQQDVVEDIDALDLNGQLDRYRDIYVEKADEWAVFVSDPANYSYETRSDIRGTLVTTADNVDEFCL